MKKYTGDDITCLFTVYSGTCLHEFKEALESIKKQSVKAKHIIIVVDGKVSNVVDSFLVEETDIFLFRLSENSGPGKARDLAIRTVVTDLVAIMDSDDISLPNRFELQLDAFNKINDLSVCGGTIQEFNGSGVSRYRILPEYGQSIVKYSKMRAPINNVTAMFVVKDYLISGGYPDLRSSEDYVLWLRFISRGFSLYNIEEVLVKVRFDENTVSRRSGLQLFQNDFRAHLENFRIKNIGCFQFVFNVSIMFIFRFTSKHLLKLLYHSILRR